MIADAIDWALFFAGANPAIMAIIAAVGAYYMARLNKKADETAKQVDHVAVLANSVNSRLSERLEAAEGQRNDANIEKATLAQQVQGDVDRRNRDDVRKVSEDKAALEARVLAAESGIGRAAPPPAAPIAPAATEPVAVDIKSMPDDPKKP